VHVLLLVTQPFTSRESKATYNIVSQQRVLPLARDEVILELEKRRQDGAGCLHGNDALVAKHADVGKRAPQILNGQVAVDGDRLSPAKNGLRDRALQRLFRIKAVPCRRP
jgi:hypothetical protein